MATRPARLLWASLLAVALYALAAYIVAPDYWRRFVGMHPSVDDVPNLTRGGDGLPGDPVNLTLHGDEQALRAAMAKAGWDVAAPLDLRDDARIVVDTLAHRAYADAPVSRLFLFARVEDIAFEMPIGGDPSRRHHVRFWRDGEGASMRWVGAATMDKSVGLSRTTGEVTHHIDADVDAERDHVLATLHAAGLLPDQWYVAGFHKVREGRNAGGDPWRTDGRLGAGRLD